MSYVGTPEIWDITIIDGIGPVYAHALNEIGLSTLDSFVKATENPDELKELSNQTLIPVALLEEWSGQAIWLTQGDLAESGQLLRPANEVESLFLKLYPNYIRPFLLHPLQAAVGFLIYAGAIHAFILAAYGGVSGTPGIKDFVDDIIYWPNQIMQAISIYYYLRLTALLKSATRDLAQNRIFKSTSFHIDSSIKCLYERKILCHLPLILTLMVAIFFIPYINTMNLKVWWSEHFISIVLMTIAFLPGWLAIAGLLVNVTLATILTNHIFRRNKIVVHPLHPDRSGGFSPLGQYSLRLSYYAIGLGIALAGITYDSYSLGRLDRDWVIYIDILVYLSVVPTLFYLPLRSAHRAMVTFRNNLIQETSQRYLRENLKAHLSSQQDPDKLKKRLDYMESLKKLEALERGYPVWPFGLKIGLNVAGTTILPVLPSIVGILIEFTD